MLPTVLCTFRSLRLLHPMLTWMLAAVVSLQGLAVVTAQARGPQHLHVRLQEESILGADFRRNLGSHAAMDRHRPWLLDAVHGHSHPASQFHYHAIDDDSVRFVDGDRFAGVPGDDDGAVGGGFASFLPLPASDARWSAPGVRDAPAAVALWTPTASFRTRLERPPRTRRSER